jgi:hypothetical protein
MKKSGDLEAWAVRISDSMINLTRTFLDLAKLAYETGLGIEWLGLKFTQLGIILKAFVRRDINPGARLAVAMAEMKLVGQEADAVKKSFGKAAAGLTWYDDLRRKMEEVYLGTKKNVGANKEAKESYASLGEAMDAAEESLSDIQKGMMKQGGKFLGMTDEERATFRSVYQAMSGITDEQFKQSTYLQNYVAGNEFLASIFEDKLKLVEKDLWTQMGLTDQDKERLDAAQKTLNAYKSKVTESSKELENQKGVTAQLKEQVVLMEATNALAKARRQEGGARGELAAAEKGLEYWQALLNGQGGASMSERIPEAQAAIERAARARETLDARMAETTQAEAKFRNILSPQSPQVVAAPTINLNVSANDIAKSVYETMITVITEAYVTAQAEAARASGKLSSSVESSNAQRTQAAMVGGW